ncbi:hypothetical protein [Conexibacter woesei]|uniref:Secreted protein n=1 Tax=Conexibacter woesei (strain DSM 14684 / CCUG 47730 / CIP 108061 / JCM 11494 / NBRC 100937 / ID131577) TaxID=469383 RepID=D3FEP4_CONWI|nr:hypothetical protein [Conexibacter woesei]ADB49718.1 hypothetical protein Cwoe_1289 [Conexibacter woesei DSM 14684]
MNPKRVGALALALAALGGAVSVASGAVGQEPAAPAADSPDPVPAPDRAKIALAKANIGALRDARQPAADAISEQIADGPLLADGVVALDSARRVRTGSKSGWLASTSDGTGVCVVIAGGLTCPPVDHVVEQGLSPGYVVREGEPVHVFGVASDAVADAALLLRDGSTRSVTIADNFFAVDTAAVPIEMRWIGPDGYETFVFPTRPGLGGVKAAP